MAKACVAQELSGDELNDYEEAFLEEIEPSELKVLSLPPNCSSGHGWCEGGKCFVCCGGRWYRLVDHNHNQWSCSQGRGLRYACEGTQYLATC